MHQHRLGILRKALVQLGKNVRIVQALIGGARVQDVQPSVLGCLHQLLPKLLLHPIRLILAHLARNQHKPCAAGVAHDLGAQLVGFSYGGDGVYALANHYPGEFAAAVPISSGCPHPEYVSESSPGNWWHVYNELDFAGCERMFAELNAFKDRVNANGGDFRMGTYPKAGHDAWTAAWREDELWDWMFSKSTARGASRRRRDGAAAAPVSLAESVCTSSVSGEDTAHGPERAADGLKATAYVAARPFSKGDWWRIDFAAPDCGKDRRRSLTRRV